MIPSPSNMVALFTIALVLLVGMHLASQSDVPRSPGSIAQALDLASKPLSRGSQAEYDGAIWLMLPSTDGPIAFMPLPAIPTDLPCADLAGVENLRRHGSYRQRWWFFDGLSPRALQIYVPGMWYGPEYDTNAYWWAWDSDRSCAVHWQAFEGHAGEVVAEVVLEPPDDPEGRPEMAQTRTIEADVMGDSGIERVTLSETAIRVERTDGTVAFEHAADFIDDKWVHANPVSGASTWRSCAVPESADDDIVYPPTWPCRTALYIRRNVDIPTIDIIFQRYLVRPQPSLSVVELEQLRLVGSLESDRFAVSHHLRSAIHVFYEERIVDLVGDFIREQFEHEQYTQSPVGGGLVEVVNRSEYEHGSGFVQHEWSGCFEEGDDQDGESELFWRFLPSDGGAIDLAREEDVEGNVDRDCLDEDWFEPGTAGISAGQVTLGLTDEAFQRHQQACRQAGSTRCSPDRFERERPATVVEVEEDYRIHETEITRRQYEYCVREGACPAIDETTCQVFDGEDWDMGRSLPRASREPNVPRTCVTRAEAQEFCAWRGGRLPSEAEWQLAAAGEEGRIFAWGNHFDPVRVNFLQGDDARLEWGYSRPKGATPQGVRHMSGNAYEWVVDDACSYADWPADTTLCHSEDGRGVVIGGSFASDGGGVRTTYRRFVDPEARLDTNGFRCRFDSHRTLPKAD